MIQKSYVNTKTTRLKGTRLKTGLVYFNLKRFSNIIYCNGCLHDFPAHTPFLIWYGMSHTENKFADNKACKCYQVYLIFKQNIQDLQDEGVFGCLRQLCIND